MQRFDDDRLLEIYETRFSAGIPQHVSVAVHEVTHPLMAARSLQDVGVLGPIVRLRNAPNRYGLCASGKWHVTFVWIDGLGAYAAKLERR